MFVLRVISILLLTKCYCSSKIKRKRLVDLVDDYSENNLLEKEFTQTQDTKCEVCNSGILSEYCVSSPTNGHEKISACKSCLKTIKLPQLNERVLILSSNNTLEVGKLTNNKNGTFWVEYLEIDDVSKITQFPKYFIKLVHEIIPNEKLCPMCNYFTFDEQKCERNNCGQTICHSCFEQVLQCEYCRLLHVGSAIKIRQQNLTTKLKKVFQRRYGKLFGILFGLIRGILFSEEKNGRVVYIVEVSNNYFWKKNEKSKMILVLQSKSIPAIMMETEIEIFKPLNYEDNFIMN